MTERAYGTARRSLGARCGLLCGVVLVVGTLFTGAARAVAPPVAPGKVPVLILDGGLGDDRFYGTHWLGQVEELVVENGMRITTGPAPTWWGGEGAPDTYVLSGSDGSGAAASKPITTQEIAWGIDQVAKRHPEGKVVLVAQGATGLQARRYLEDLGTPRQSSRADVVGLVLLGTPNSGIELRTTYPNLDIWEPYAAGAGMKPDDLMPGSAILAELDKGRIPGVVKTLVVQGVGVKLADKDTDAVVTREGGALLSDVTRGPVDSVSVRARASEAWSLRDTWFSSTKKGGALLNAVDDNEVERLGPASGYATAPETPQLVKTYYQAWFGDETPTTHITTRIVIDVSGSMAEDIGDVTKLDAAKRAADDFIVALANRQALSSSVPEDVGVVTFNESAVIVAAGGTALDQVKASVAALAAKGNTDVGKALDTAIKSFDGSPAPADKVLVFLSDGINTAGLDEQGILNGPVAEAKKRGIRIETIALGGVGSNDGTFLEQIAAGTGGTYHNSKDQFELRRDFLRARFASLGEVVVDSAVVPGTAGKVVIGDIAEGTRVLEFAVVADAASPEWRLMRDGKEVPKDSITQGSTVPGLIVGTLTAPSPGAYTVELPDGKGSAKAHVFAVKQIDAFRPTGTAAVQDDSGIMMLIVVGALGLVAIVLTVVLSRRKTTPEDSHGGTTVAQTQDPDTVEEAGE